MNLLGADRVPLAGVAIGDGWVDPINQIPGYPELVYALGLADNRERAIVQDYCDATVALIEAGDYVGAFGVWDRMLNGDVFQYANYFHNITGSNDYDNFGDTNEPESFEYYAKYVDQRSIRDAIHVGDVPFGTSASTCEKHLLADFHHSYRPELETLLNNSYKVLVYSGQYDVIIGTALTERFLPFIRWPLAEAYATKQRAVWRLEPSDPDVAGFATQVGTFTRVVVRGAGHIVPADQPKRALDMIHRWIRDVPYENLPDPTLAGEL